MFNPEKYRSTMEESRKRLDIARRFEEADRVPIHISTAGSFYSRLLGVNIRDFHTDREVMLDVQLKGLEWAFEELGDDRAGCSIQVELGPIGEALLFECPIEYPDDTSPRIVPILKDRKDVESLQVPDPAECPRLLWALEQVELVREMVAKRALKMPAGGGISIHPPLSCACALMEPSLVYAYMYEDPELIRILFDKCLEAYFRLAEFMIARNGGKQSGHRGLADDNSAFVSDPMYREMVMPYNMRIYERYGQNGRSLHTDGPNDHHFATYANLMGITSMDIGGFSDIEVAKKAMHGKTVISGGLNCKDLYYDLDAAKPAIHRAIRIGAPGGGFTLAVGGETYAGVNPDTLIKAVAYAKEVGKYPLNMKRLAE